MLRGQSRVRSMVRSVALLTQLLWSQVSPVTRQIGRKVLPKKAVGAVRGGACGGPRGAGVHETLGRSSGAGAGPDGTHTRHCHTRHASRHEPRWGLGTRHTQCTETDTPSHPQTPETGLVCATQARHTRRQERERGQSAVPQPRLYEALLPALRARRGCATDERFFGSAMWSASAYTEEPNVGVVS